MLLLLTLYPADKNKLLLRYDTETRKGDYIFKKLFVKEIKASKFNKIISTSGIVYSGNWLCFGIQIEKHNDYIAFFDIYKSEILLHHCTNSKTTGNIISVYPGKLYLDSKDTNSISSVDFDCVNLSYANDNIHYALDEKNDCGFNSLCSHNSVWFVAQQKMNRIIDLTHDRVVFSDIDNPCCLFFNHDHRLCFIERGKNLFHFGDSIVHVGDSPTATIEDRNEGGYWVACGSILQFIAYDGSVVDERNLSKWAEGFNNIIEAEGIFTK